MRSSTFVTAACVVGFLALASTTSTGAQQEQEAEPAAARAVVTYDRHGTFFVDGRRFFPIGLTMPPPLGSSTPWGTDAVDEVVSAGVTLLRAGPFGRPWDDAHLASAAAWNDAAASRGVHTWIHLRELAAAQPGSAEEEMLSRVVGTLRDSPGVALWKGADEPWPRYAPFALAHAFQLVKGLDSGHLVLTTFGPFSKDGRMLVGIPDPPDLRPYNTATDVHAVDVYPVYYHLRGVREPKLHKVGEWTRATIRATGRKTVSTTLQICFAGSDDPNGSGAFLLPTRRQERYMIYDAIVNGARGLVFFGGESRLCHSAIDAAHGWNWTFWQRALRDLIEEVGIGSPLHQALVRPDTTVRLKTSTIRVQAVSRRVGRDLWVMATHRGPKAEPVVIRGLPAWTRRGRTYPTGRAVTARAGSIRERYPGWGVRVYRFTRPG